VWYRIVKRDNKEEFYEYPLVYTDDLLAVATNPKAILENPNLSFYLKPESVGHPNIYLGSKVSKAKLADGIQCWCNSSCQWEDATKQDAFADGNQIPPGTGCISSPRAT
jgi:hypothetical protein